MKKTTRSLVAALLTTASFAVSADAVKFADGWNTWKNAGSQHQKKYHHSTT